MVQSQGLTIHQVSPNGFELTGLRTGSIRDQLLRASMLVAELKAAGYVSQSLPLLVLGGGPAGVAAALSAAKAGVSSTVVEIEDQLFSSLRLANKREVSPYEYDWPQDHWTERRFPRNGETVPPLSMRRRTGADLWQVWNRAIARWMTSSNGTGGSGLITLQTNCDARCLYIGPQGGASKAVHVNGPWADGQPAKWFGAVLSCTGIGQEKTSDTHLPERWGGYRGPKYWIHDDGLSSSTQVSFRSALVSGGGDGALQDFQRAATGVFGQDLVERLEYAADNARTPFRFARALNVAVVHAAEDRGRRAHAWRAAPGLTRELKEWQERFVQAVEDQLQQFSAEQLEDLANGVFRPELRNGAFVVTLVLPRLVPDFCYALNRYLLVVLLRLARHISPAVANPIRVFFGAGIISIRASDKVSGPIAHTCGNPAECRGKSHTVIIQSFESQRITATIADLVVVRHGTSTVSLLGGSLIPEHQVPFDMPR